MFLSDYRYGQYIIALAISTYMSINKKMYFLLLLLIPALLIFLITGDQGPKEYYSSLFHFTAVVGSLLTATIFIARPSLFTEPKQRRFVILSGAFIICFLVFSSMNFFTYRYLLATIIPGLCIIAALTDKLTQNAKPWLFFTALACMMTVSGYAYIHDDGFGDTDLSCYGNMQLEQSVVDYLEQNNYFDKSIGAGSFMHREHLTDPNTGFLHGKPFTNVRWDLDDKTEIIIMDNIEYDSRYDWVKQQQNFKLAYRNEKGSNWVEIYVRK